SNNGIGKGFPDKFTELLDSSTNLPKGTSSIVLECTYSRVPNLQDSDPLRCLLASPFLSSYWRVHSRSFAVELHGEGKLRCYRLPFSTFEYNPDPQLNSAKSMKTFQSSAVIECFPGRR